MGEMIGFPSNGGTCGGYLSGEAGRPGVVVIQEWWGLVDHIKDVCDRFAAEGFLALAPDLYHGKATGEPDEAGKLMMDLNLEQAARDMAGSAAELRSRGNGKVGCVGFCMGGALTMFLSTVTPLDAAAPFYGYPQQGEPDWSKVAGPIQMHFAEHDDYFSPKKAQEIVEELQELGKHAELYVYEGTEHAFFNDTRPDVYKADAAKLAWGRTLDFFRKHLM